MSFLVPSSFSATVYACGDTTVQVKCVSLTIESEKASPPLHLSPCMQSSPHHLHSLAEVTVSEDDKG